MRDNRILVVDDEESIRRLLQKTLGAEGYTVEVVGSAEEALPIVQRSDIHMFLLDLQLPGIDGLELCRRIRTARPVACVFALTGYASTYDLEACRETGFDDYFTKPFEIEDLVKAVQDGFRKIERWSAGIKEESAPTS